MTGGQGGGARHKEVPTLVKTLKPHKVVKVAAGERHALAITDKGGFRYLYVFCASHLFCYWLNCFWNPNSIFLNRLYANRAEP